MPGWGSWDWVGTFLLEQLTAAFNTSTFEQWKAPEADAVVVIKHVPPAEWVERVKRRSAVIYCPIDQYGAPTEIDADAGWLRACARVIVHCRRLLPYLGSFAAASYLDHPIKYATPTRKVFRPVGPLLWVGVRSNLAPLVAWVNSHPLPAPLDILTNPEILGRIPSPAELGFRLDCEVRVHEWTPERHLQFVANARAALDIKGDDFRSRHKPPAKAIDFIASGLPLAMNPGTSPVEHLAALGLKVPSPLDIETWLSERYWKETRRVGERLTRELAPTSLAGRFQKLINAALADQPARRVVAVPAPVQHSAEDEYRAALDAAERGDHRAAEAALAALDKEEIPVRLRALVVNDRAAIAAARGEREVAAAGFRRAIELDPDCAPARANLNSLDDTETPKKPETQPRAPLPNHPGTRPTRVAVISFLFNWPTTGGGNVHTAELTMFLAAAGYEVRHLYAKFDPWRIGQVATSPHPAEPVAFTESEWSAERIVERFRAAVDAFDPDWVILTDSWNMKPLLAAAVSGRPYVLRLQALECLCPLNNVRLLPLGNGVPRQCTRHQLATPDECARCICERGHTSGELHRVERALAGVGSPEYQKSLTRAFAEAAAVMAVNPLTATMVEPHARDVRVVTAGMDPDRFPFPFPDTRKLPKAPGRLRILFAGLTHEWMKGFHVLRAACERLWTERQDFEITVTDSQPDDRSVEPWARYVGWQSQDGLPAHLASADIVVVPTVAQEALGRTAVEGMAAGKPVVASRIGGLSFTVTDGATGLLCEPNDPNDLAAKLSALLADPELRQRLGQAGRCRFEEHYTWPAIIDRHYRPLFGLPNRPIDSPRTGSQTRSNEGRDRIERPRALVVISYYASRPAEPLVRLLDSMAAHAAGSAHATRVVVNRDAGETLTLPDRHRGVEIIYRPNSGYNIGAWEAGWRTGPAFDEYLFVQDECVVVRDGWAAAYAQAAAQPGTGLVGECLSPNWDAPWSELAERFRGHSLKDHAIGGRPAERVACYLDFFRRRNIPPGERGDHLQTLVLYVTRTVLERVGGFPEGRTYGEAIGAEIGISKKVQAAGLRLAQVAATPFEYIEHPQWLHRKNRL
jgi:glycosyltransferase involved in cell wall biosynthesis